jgi:hypothetical protein
MVQSTISSVTKGYNTPPPACMGYLAGHDPKILGLKHGKLVRGFDSMADRSSSVDQYSIHYACGNLSAQMQAARALSSQSLRSYRRPCTLR